MNMRQIIFSFAVGLGLISISMQFSSIIPALNSMLWLGVALLIATTLKITWQQFSPAPAHVKAR
jgi:hypothetical protein